MEHAQGLLLKDKWALVTGASHGIGRALAEALASESAAVILTSDMLSQDGLDKVCIVISYIHTLALAIAA